MLSRRKSRNPLGFKCAQHHGWKNQKYVSRFGGVLPQPYPRFSTADREYNLGAQYARAGFGWEGEQPGAEML